MYKKLLAGLIVFTLAFGACGEVEDDYDDDDMEERYEDDDD